MTRARRAQLRTPVEGHARVTSGLPIRQHNLPALHVQLFGREQDTATVRDLVLQAPGRLVTLTGTGGCGKTQLALLIASRLIDSFPDGVWLVDLVPVQSAHLLAQAVVSSVGLHEQPGETPLQTLIGWIAGYRKLLVLDNCEHVIDACAQLADALLSAGPNLHLLTTSREPLRVSGESIWRVPSLDAPELRSGLSPEEVAQFPAVQLFVQRGQSVNSDFALTSRNALVVAAICARLEGLPLAIELAAAWIRVLGVEQILERLDDTFDFLAGGSRSAPTRQQTMRATLDWSYSFLTETERVLFQRLAVFVGGWSLEAAENVCSDQTLDPRQVLVHLSRLVDTSLVQVEEAQARARYRLLEPVRQYAQAHLGASGELDAVRRRHAAFYLSYAEHWERDANYGGPGRQAGLLALERELDNLRATLRWCLEQGDAEDGILLARVLWTFWVIRGLYTEGRSWLVQLAALPSAASAPAMRAMARAIEATLALRQGDYGIAKQLLEQVVPYLPHTKAHAPRLVHSVPTDLGFIARQAGDTSAARAHLEEALAAVRTAGLRIDEAQSLQNLGDQALDEGDLPRARALLEEGLSLARSIDDAYCLGEALRLAGRLHLLQGDLSASRQFLEESVAVHRQLGERFGLAQALDALAVCFTATGQFSKAGEAFGESLHIRQSVGDRFALADSLERIGALAAAQHFPTQAVQLVGAASSMRERTGSTLTPTQRIILDEWLVPLQESLSPEVIKSAWEAGRSMSLDKALELALAATQTPFVRPDRVIDVSGKGIRKLTQREQEVAVLLADGLTNRQIAERLVVSQRTVAAHVEHMLDKLGFASRHQVATWAAENGLDS